MSDDDDDGMKTDKELRFSDAAREREQAALEEAAGRELEESEESERERRDRE